MAETLVLEEKERKQLIGMFQELDVSVLRNVAESISIVIRALEGKPLEATDIITKFTNVKNILERSRFPTYPLLAKQVYLRLIAKTHDEGKICERWANLEAEALISYKGKSREEYVDVSKHAIHEESQQLIFGPRYEEQKKKRFWQRERKKEEPEFVSQ